MVLLQMRDLWNTLPQEVVDAKFVSPFWCTPRETR